MSTLKSTNLFVVIFFSVLMLSIPALAQNPPSINGEIVPNDYSSRPDLGLWEYTLTVTWNTGSNAGLDHLDMLLDEIGRACSQTDLAMGFVPGDTVGLSPADVRDMIYFQPEFLFYGDPLVPTPGQMLKMSPFPNQAANLGPTGSAVFTIYSDFSPTGVEYPGLFMVDVTGQYVGSGMMMGFVPELPCDPVPAEKKDWGYIKSLYGH